MNNKIKILDYDIIYLSYDEPNAEKNYADLCKKIPWAKRVHGVKGSDSAHKACANISETDRFITIDGDNIVDENFVNQEIGINIPSIETSVISWAAENVINGLIYGNGGIKCWPKEYVLNMKTHENADPNNIEAQVEFCWNTHYHQIDKLYSKIYNNGSAKQAWRAGFREGVKMCLDRGTKPSIDNFHKNHWRNLHRLYVWTMVGADVENGMWAIYGAREGLYKTMCTDWDYVNVRDFDWLNAYWKNSNYDNLESLRLLELTEELGISLKKHLNIPIGIDPLSADQSKFFKTVYLNPNRTTSGLIHNYDN